MGIVQGKDGYLYINASEYDMDGWLEYGGEVYRVDTELLRETQQNSPQPFQYILVKTNYSTTLSKCQTLETMHQPSASFTKQR